MPIDLKIKMVPLSIQAQKEHVEASVKRALSSFVGKRFGVDVTKDDIAAAIDVELSKLPSDRCVRDVDGQFWEITYAP